MDDPTAILRRVNETYSQCRSYSDSGFAIFDDVQQNKERIEFRTLFVRPDYFSRAMRVLVDCVPTIAVIICIVAGYLLVAIPADRFLDSQ
jgi:hypothetical protein